MADELSEPGRQTGGRVMSNFCIRYIKEVRFIPNFAAAPDVPPITQLVFCSVRKMRPRSALFIVTSAGVAGGVLSFNSVNGT